MKTIFVYPDIIIKSDPNWNGYYYEGLACLSAVLKKAGHETALVHVAKPLTVEELVARVGAHVEDPSKTIIAFSATTNQFPYIREWAPALKKAFSMYHIVGGIHPTLDPEDALKAEGIDAICRGDGEKPLLELTRRLEAGEALDDIPSLWVKGVDGTATRNGLGELTVLDELPLPDWSLYAHFEELPLVRDKVGIFMGTRGCPYDCSYCCNKALIDMAKGRGKYMRYKSVDHFLDELEAYLQRHPDTWGFFFEDDIFGVKKTWMAEFAEKYPSRIGKPFGCNMRPNLVTEDLVEELVKAGCVRVQMAIESGNDEVRNAILNRDLSNEQLVSAFQLFKERGVTVVSYNMVGSPHETPKAVLDTIKINAEIAPELIQHSITYPYAGTALYELCEEANLIGDQEVTDYFEDSALKLDTISRTQILFYHHHFKGFVKWYQKLRKLPRPLKVVAEKTTDFILTRKSAPRFMEPLIGLWGRMQGKKARVPA
ncbi:MAG: B12-binding domain-containing radical SAM protein [Planctomycetes bacterium]|nr:B12-binding domain-containing radical SAM protein [Planctomycetota bacterium]